MSPRLGGNINGPSLIRVPRWIRNPLGTYYLYFAHHKGRFIRLAYSDSLAGPWKIHEPGVLDLAESLFEITDLEPPSKGHGEDGLPPYSGQFLYAHVASPDLHVDRQTQTIRMYYHGLLPDADQQTRVAYSSDGLRFSPQSPLLGPPYFRVFGYDGSIYAVAWGGALLRAKSWKGPFEAGPRLLSSPPLVPAGMTLRHAAVLCRQDRLDLFYSCIGDRPERILHAVIRLAPDWADWRVEAPATLLSPEREWEGAGLPLTQSVIGAAEGPERELRDPCIFSEAGRHYLLYSGAGESGIGIAEIFGL